MRVVSRKALREFWEQPNHHDAEAPLRAWYKEAEKADWATPADIKEQFRSASFLASNRVVFNIAGNKYRLGELSRSRDVGALHWQSQRIRHDIRPVEHLKNEAGYGHSTTQD